ncbi:MAG TPA: hypothetical protein DCR16_06940 [Lachnospiraceae bacterium]|nr:hypothetical protein [Lachnospiraceae bacterium]
MIMTDLLLFLYPLLLIVLLLQGASLSPRGETGPRFLCPDQTGMIRAAACLCIILHHLVQHSTGYGARYAGPVTFFNDAGFLFTGIFFFFSGYGLTRSLETREGYLKTFPARRFPSVLIPFWITNLLLILAGRIWYGFWWNPLKLLGDFTGITLVNSNGWFIIEITLFYALFWFFFTFIRRRDAALALLSLAVLLTILFAFFRGHDPQGHAVHWFRGEWWYNSTPVFLFGLVFGRFRDRIEAFFRRHYPLLLTTAAVLFAAVFRVSVKILKRYGYYYTSTPAGLRGAGLTLLFQSLAALLFALLVLLLSMKVTLRSPVMSYISGISLELFLLHGFWIDPVFYEARMPDMVFFGLVLTCSAVAASLTAPVIKAAVRAVTGLLLRQADKGAEVPLTLERQNLLAKKEARRRTLRKGIPLLAVVLCILFWISAGRRFVMAGREYEEELAAIRSAGIGEEVYYGYFETDGIPLGKERLSWIILKKEQDRACLICRNGIAGSFYNRRHAAVSWEESDLYQILSAAPYTDMFSAREQENLIPADGNPVTLLSVREARELFPNDQSRELAITTAAEQGGTNINRASKHHEWDMKGYRSSWWWLKGEPGSRSETAPVVNVDGTIVTDEKEVNRPGGAIRPVIWVRY